MAAQISYDEISELKLMKKIILHFLVRVELTERFAELFNYLITPV